MTDLSPSTLAAIERVERLAWIDMFNAAPPAYATGQGLRAARLGTIGLLACRGLPIAEFNRAMSVGVDGNSTQAMLDEVRAWLREHAAAEAVLQCPPTAGNAALQAWLRSRALEAQGNGWAKFLRGTQAVVSRRNGAGIDVRQVTAETETQFGQVVQAGFGLPEDCAPWFANLAGRPGWRLYLAWRNGVPIASGALFLHEGWGWMGIDATLPGERGLGAQTELIARRVADGIDAGATGLTAETGQPAPGLESGHTSFNNYLRGGFEHVYIRGNYR
jgi:hypothetical protein